MKIKEINRLTYELDAKIKAPPSKSYTHRALFAAALSEGRSKIIDPLFSDDIKYTINSLKQLGVRIIEHSNNEEVYLEVQGSSGKLEEPRSPLYIGNSGTTLRFLMAISSLVKGTVVIDGDEEVRKRPVKGLEDSLKKLGLIIESNNGCPPVKITSKGTLGGETILEPSQSSQYLSALLLASPFSKPYMKIKLAGQVPSSPYVEMTLDVMKKFGVLVERKDFSEFTTSPSKYLGQEYRVEGDFSNSSYFMAIAAISGGKVTIQNLNKESKQADRIFVDILQNMGCKIFWQNNSLILKGGKLKGLEIDMKKSPDIVPTLAVVSAFAEDPTKIYNIETLRFKETDRLRAVANELSKVGCKIEEGRDYMIINPRRLHGAQIETYKDHRMAMSFAVAGLFVEGIKILDPDCVSKSYPNFWEDFSKVCGGIN
ncbi:MAG: 3-phosphoshikimate 1-carboxyvinyltransferase [Candidatus Methanofastidiosum methylothiophilum]|uniref:3-phosphoshikimate 1-carboxyvinyltransferase n=1 Tax=Candidatus Methanofastidiosum methylothiophilum TaxID=1705564 RepID=A0A150II01_9EURY|nr:MAG: 3-phosphoshikimate 1-carboxyvinyltransferase [Candidatus Methanofastidiosum methylthiophilus]KYC46779.1 MAG: 3-phosphoshikimate 1-carboxyvinyltransferase [Candidatus Methanofastidiosum methylthiophilus]KYC49206.1 MAG: 3-phosphoshikimate 1-carboxyvinyltransferase [Candidatus Methanofastidiosum methylthiophilus]